MYNIFVHIAVRAKVVGTSELVNISNIIKHNKGEYKN